MEGTASGGGKVNGGIAAEPALRAIHLFQVLPSGTVTRLFPPQDVDLLIQLTTSCLIPKCLRDSDVETTSDLLVCNMQLPR